MSIGEDLYFSLLWFADTLAIALDKNCAISVEIKGLKIDFCGVLRGDGYIDWISLVVGSGVIAFSSICDQPLKGVL